MQGDLAWRVSQEHDPRVLQAPQVPFQVRMAFPGDEVTAPRSPCGANNRCVGLSQGRRDDARFRGVTRAPEAFLGRTASVLTGLPAVTSGWEPGASVSLLHQVRLTYKMGPKAVPLTIEPSASQPCEWARASRQE